MATLTSTPASLATDPSAVAWGAVIAGAIGAAALSLVLLLLGGGLGLAVISPWSARGISEDAAAVSTILWITVVQLLASGLGGYLAGRLRTRWFTVHSDEVFFRDTAHGFLAWSVATLLMATVLSSAVGATLTMGIAPAEVTSAAEMSEEERKAAALAALWMVVSLFIGAFISAWAATFGGRLRDKAVLN